MNQLLLRFVFFLSLTLLPFSGIAQLVPAFSYADGYNACGQSILTIQLNNTSSESIYPIIAEFKLNSAMQATDFSTSLPDDKIILSITGNKLKLVFDTVLAAGSHFDILATMASNKACSQLGCGKFFSTTDTLSLKYNSKEFFYYNNNILSSPCLTYDESSFVNRVVSAFLGDTITRQIVLKNTGGSRFNGTIELKDVFGEFVEIESITSTFPGYSIHSSGLINDSTYVFNADFPSVANGDSIVLIEKVIVKQCIKDEEGKSSIFLNWSCDNSLCNAVNPYPILAQVIKNKKKPDVVIRRQMTPESNCMGSKTKYQYVVKNQGTRPATELVFGLHTKEYNTYTYIDRNSLVLKDTSGMRLLYSTASGLNPHNREIHTFQHSCIIAQPLYSWAFKFESLMPGDSFIVETEGYQCCPGDDTSNIELLFETWKLDVDYKDECKEENFSASSPGDAQNALALKQFYEPIVTDMHGGDVERFEIFNIDFTTDFYRLNTANAAFKLHIKLDTGLVYRPGSLSLSSVYGYDLLPDSEQIMSGAGTDGYIDNYLEATFHLPDTFVTNPVFFARFMRNSSVFFTLEALCSAKEPTSRFTQELYIVPDLNCSPACEILLSTITTEISVHCPGCVTPGWVATSFSANRINLGDQDNDNNRLPDYPVYTPADRSKIKSNRCIPGDSLETELHAYFQDGDAVNGVSTEQLETDPTAPFHFRYTYVSTRITSGKLFEARKARVILYDIDHGAIASGVDSVDLPLSCVIKVPNPNDSLSDAEFFFDLSLDTLYKYGIDPSYEYDPGDGLKVLCTYKILEPSDFYLSHPPTTKDPWLAVEDAPIILNGFGNLVYLTGNRNTFDNRNYVDAGGSFATSPEIPLDSTMIYWCEAYGSASTLVGKRKLVSFYLPENIQCQDQIAIHIELNPAGGIFRNAFPFEYRNFLRIDSIQATIPAGYTLSDWTIENSIQKPDGALEFEACALNDTLTNVTVNGNLVSIVIDSLYKRYTSFGTESCLEELVYGDESINTTIRATLTPDCDLPETPVNYASPVLYYTIQPNQQSFADKALKEYCTALPPVTCALYELVPAVTKVNAALIASPPSNEIQLSQSSFCYPLNLEELNGAGAFHSFIKVRSLNNKVRPASLTDKETGKVFQPDSLGVFHLDTIPGKALHQYLICFDNNCGKLIEKDTVRILFGHDCFNDPDATLSNICKLDSIEHYVFPGTLDIGGFLNGPDEVHMCEPFEVTNSYQITGIGAASNLFLRLQKDSASLLSATLSINDQSAVDIFSLLQPNTGTFELKQPIQAAKAQGLEAGDKIKFNFRFTTDCSYSGQETIVQPILVTSACDTLYGDTLRYAPPTLVGYPTPDHKSLALSGEALSNLGGLSSLMLTVVNDSSEATQNTTRVSLLLPEGFTYSSMVSGAAPAITDSSLVWDLPAGIEALGSSTLQVKLNHAPVECDSVAFQLLLGDLSVGCSNQPCLQKDTAYLYKLTVRCYPCPPVISVSERCKEVPVFNVLQWQYPGESHCPTDETFIYKLYYSRSSGGPFVLLDSMYTKTYTHDSIEAYDGCYYVTVTDPSRQLTSRSNTVCKSTCREQFQCGDLFITNLVTPNRDGNNETFQITGAYTALKVEIYNAWGSAVFKSDDYKNDWNAEGLADGVYYYHLYIDGSDEKCLGWIHVLGGK